jgi:NAD(P)-dependent dehydrogenase (short-subunit alcohol dehydrogenase family)
MNLKDKICLVTGGTSGIGRAAALDFAARGAHLVVHGRSAEAGASLQQEITAVGRRCELVFGDIGDPAVAKACVVKATETFGGLDVLVHSAGEAAPGSLLDLDPAVWYRAFDVHVHAVFHLCREAAPIMKERGGGAIILISSAAGARGCLGALAYGVVKGSLPQFARALARELADSNIRVNCVSPGVIRTRFQKMLSPEQVRNNIDNRIPLHREGQPEDVASVISMLVENEFVTGEDVAIDGGMTMRIA